MSLPLVAIVGRPNVGKSSLFNRILRKRLAVVDAEAGVTRDRHYATADWTGREFRLVDTGGMVPDSRDSMERSILEQSDFAIAEADLILLIVDVQTGSDLIDQRLAQNLMKSGKSCLLAVNKVDTSNLENDVYEFMNLGMGEPFAVSAASGFGVAELLDMIVEKLPEPVPMDGDEDRIRVAVVGRPNVGKSSFINQLLGEDRLIVSDIAGTTRDAIDTPFEYDGRKYVMVDTAGLRRKYKVHENVEFYTSLRSMRAIDDCDVALVLIDAADGITSQDQRVLAMVMETRRPAVIVANKWDLVEKDSHTADAFAAKAKDQLAPFTFLPIIFCSALTGQRVPKVLSLVQNVAAENRKRVPTTRLNDFLKKVYDLRKPPARKGKYIKFKYLTQSEVEPPTFIFFANYPDLIDKSYLKYLSNQLRAEFGFEGVPIRLKCRRN